MPKKDLERYCEIIAAVKFRTSNRKGRHLSTDQIIRLLEDYGIQTPDELIKLPKGLLKKSTVNRYLDQWDLGPRNMLRQPVATHFQAKHANDCWQFDLSPSDPQALERWPTWVREGKGKPVLMLFNVVDDRSGVAYQEYRCVYGEDVEAGLRFLFNAMTIKSDEFPCCGIPKMIYTDNGPIARSLVFRRVMEYLGVEVRTHMPMGKDGRRKTARSKGKVERPFRTVKEAHETLYHFHKPENEEEANAWLLKFLIRYNNMRHRSEEHARIEDWLQNLPESGIREMCSWERFSTFAREPERRKVGPDAQITVNGVSYQLDGELAGEVVVLWWGVFDHELYVEFGEKRFGPFSPTGGPIPLHRYRKFKKTSQELRMDRIENWAEQISIPKEALVGSGVTPAFPDNVLARTQKNKRSLIQIPFKN